MPPVMRKARHIVIGVMAGAMVIVPAFVARAQRPTASPGATASPDVPLGNWTKYMAWSLAGIVVLTALMALVGLVLQGPGFRKVEPGE